MISATYFVAAAILAVLAALLAGGALGHVGLHGAAVRGVLRRLAAASAGYLTVSETFPLEIRAMAIALFYAISTGIGGARRPAAVRQAARRRRPDRRRRRLLDRGGPDGARRDHGDRLRRRRRAAVARGRSPSRCRPGSLDGRGERRRARPAGQDVGDELVDAFLEPAAARRAGARRGRPCRAARRGPRRVASRR